MDDWIQAVALLIIIIASGASTLLSNWREEQKKREMKPTQSQPPKDIPSYSPPSSKPAPKQMEWEKTEQGWQKKSSSPQEPTRPVRPKTGDTLTDIFRELFDVEQPKPVFMEPEEIDVSKSYRPPKSGKPKASKISKGPGTAIRGTISSGPTFPKKVTILEKPSKPRSSALVKYAKEADRHPLRSAIVLSEIIGPPVSLRQRTGPRIHL